MVVTALQRTIALALIAPYAATGRKYSDMPSGVNASQRPGLGAFPRSRRDKSAFAIRDLCFLKTPSEGQVLSIAMPNSSSNHHKPVAKPIAILVLGSSVAQYRPVLHRVLRNGA
jgi:hypothetical protein